MARLLIVDDEIKIFGILSAILDDEGHDVVTASSAEEGLEKFHGDSFDLVVTDLALPGKSGLDLLKEVKEAKPEVQVVMMTAYATVKTAVEAMRLGAFHYITKPFDNEEMVLTLQRALEVNALTHRVASLENQLRDRFRFESLVGQSTAWTGVLDVVDRLSKVEGPVLLLGESGTGKERVAKALHQASARAGGPFVPVNCGAIPETLFESTFFGHLKGSFTGAEKDQAGCFVSARGGVLFLDEVGELPLDAQVKLLRALQENEVTPVGGHQPIDVDVRIVAATNRNLEKEVSEGRFREDLYYRLNVLVMELPPLRKRRGDISLMLDHFLTYFSEKEGLKVEGFTSRAREELENYPWPGNIRELENAVYRMMVLAQGREITINDFPERIRRAEAVKDLDSWNSQEGDLVSLVEGAVTELESTIIRERLDMFEGSKTKTAESLGISRKTLFNKMKAYDIS